MSAKNVLARERSFFSAGAVAIDSDGVVELSTYENF